MGDILVTVKINTDKNTKHTRQRTLRPFGAWAGVDTQCFDATSVRLLLDRVLYLQAQCYGVG